MKRLVRRIIEWAFSPPKLKESREETLAETPRGYQISELRKDMWDLHQKVKMLAKLHKKRFSYCKKFVLEDIKPTRFEEAEGET